MSLLRPGYKKTVVSVLPASTASHLSILMKASALQRAPARTEPKDVSSNKRGVKLGLSFPLPERNPVLSTPTGDETVGTLLVAP